MGKTKHSSDFWLDEFDIDWDFSENSNFVDVSNSQSRRTATLIRMSAARRAVANYVTILTNKTIPVMFNDQNVSMTDGKTVYIGADINEKENFDVAVGLALHEGSHIRYSNFDLFKTIWQRIPREIYDYTEKLGINKESVADICRMMLNLVEDRYIDYMIYKNAPGYRGYYQSLYDKYFNSSAIDDGLKSKLYRNPSIESYMYRLINITNKHTDLNALPGLYDIAKTLDLSNMIRLDTPEKRLEVALDIATQMFKNVTEYDSQEQNPAAGRKDERTISDISGISGSSGEAGEGEAGESGEGEADSSDKDDSKPGNGNLDSIFGGNATNVADVNQDAQVTDIGEDKDVSLSKLKRIQKAFEKQKNFVSGDIKKKKIARKESLVLTVLEQSKIDLVDVGGEYVKSQNGVGAIECVLVKNMTRELVLTVEFPLGSSVHYLYGSNNDPHKVSSVVELQRYIDEGISMGVKIGKRLQFRNEVNIDKFSRRETGKIDKRLLHELGCETENVFYSISAHKYKKMNFHISVDASSSMRGDKWNRTMRLCTAIAKAASMLENIRVSISFRTTMDKLPYVVIGYDSAVDKFVKIKSIFSFLQPNGLTPEGLAFEAIMRVLPKAEENTDNYFINISDGEPCYTFAPDGSDQHISYSGEAAARHTRNQTKKIRDYNYNVISYFISDSDGYGNKLSELFKMMYGQDAIYINVGNINQIVSTLNKKMLESIDN